MMISHHDLDLLNAYLDDALDADTRAALEARLSAEPVLRRELESLRAVVSMVRALPTLTAPRSFALTPDMARRAQNRSIQRALPLLGAAAAIALVVMGAILFSRPVTPPNQMPSVDTAVALIGTGTPLVIQSPPAAATAVVLTMPTQTAVVSARALPTPTIMVDLMAAAPMAAEAAPQTAGSGLHDAALPESDRASEAFAVPAAPGTLDDAQMRPPIGAVLVEVLLELLRLLLAWVSAG